MTPTELTQALAIHAEGLTVRYGEHLILDGLDFSARAGEITALLGRNGAGKTTFVRTIATLQPFVRGSLSVAGHDVGTHPQAVRASIGLAGQHAAVVPELTGWENLHLVGRLYGLARGETKQAIRRVVEEFDLSDFVDRRASTYSGGQRRRLDLAATFVLRPSVLLLDEPTTGLDPQSRRALWQTIAGLPQTGTSVLLTTQYLDEAQALADHIAIIDHGRIIRAGTTDQLRREAATTTLTVAARLQIAGSTAEQIAARLGATITQRRDHQFTLTGRFDLDTAHRAVTENGLPSDQITEFALAPPSLDDVFLTMTQKDTTL